MNTRPAIAMIVVLMAGTALCWGQRSRTAAPAPRHAPATAPASPSSSTSTSTSTLHTASVPPGWGLAPGPASTVNHPGGLPGTYTSVQPLAGIQPLIPTGTVNTMGPAPARGHGSQVWVVPVYVPVAVYPGSSYMAGAYLEPGGDPNAAQVADQPAPQQYAPVYSTQTAPPDNEVTPPGDSNNPSPADVPYTLLAFKDHSFFAVTDYWVENNRLNYVTNYGTTGSAALDQLDLSLTLKLNTDRGVAFELHGK